jgi:hypothetical protein
MMKHLAAVCGSLLLASAGCSGLDTTSHTNQALTPTNAATTWHANAQTLVGAFTGRGNPAQAYTHALVTVAIYDATVAIRGGYRPFIADVAAPEGADLSAAVATAAYKVGFTRVTAATGTAKTDYTNKYNAYIAAIPAGQAKDDGIAVGNAVADAVLAARSLDNFYNTAVYANPPADPGVWQAKAVADNEATAGANDYQMAFVIPLTADSPDARRLDPPIDMGSRKYADAVNEVKEYGRKVSASRTADMTNAVQFWTESGFTLWTRNVRDIVIGRGLDDVESARALAMFGVATGDGMLACWDAKYAYMNWRPFQAITRANEDGNKRTDPEAGWIPLVRANHPEYPAGHGCYGAAATNALQRAFGEDFAVTLSSTGNQVVGWPVVPTRAYDSLGAIVEDTGNARVWGGLHYRTTMNASAKWMKHVAHDALKHNFKPLDDDGDDDDGDED